MAYELVYTSAPEGLNRGSSGFCVVACTKGLGPRLVVTLEGLSAYKPLYPHYAPNAWDNPISRTHYIYEANGEQQHILSRICFNGVDHTQRSNKLASHLVLSEREALTAQGGPSSLLLHEELFKDASWSIKAEYFPKQKEIPVTAVEVQKCTLWEAVMGDAGWAGYLAQTYIDFPNKNVYIAYKPEQNKDILPLIHEAMSLLPDELRWKVTFNTYFVNLPAGMSCSWRCCPTDSEAIRAAKRSPMNIIIDITKPQPLGKNSELITVARTGIIKKPKETFEPETEETKTLGSTKTSRIVRSPHLKIDMSKNRLQGKTINLSSLQSGNLTNANNQQFNNDSVEEYENETSSFWERKKSLIITFAIICLLLVGIGGIVYFVSVKKEKQTYLIQSGEYKKLREAYDGAKSRGDEVRRKKSSVRTEKQVNGLIEEVKELELVINSIKKAAEKLLTYQSLFEKHRQHNQEITIEIVIDDTPRGLIETCNTLRKDLIRELASLNTLLEEVRKKQVKRDATKKSIQEKKTVQPPSPVIHGKTLPSQISPKGPEKKAEKTAKQLPVDDSRYLWIKSKSFHKMAQNGNVDIHVGGINPDKISIFLIPNMTGQKVGTKLQCEPDQYDHRAIIETTFDKNKGILSFVLKGKYMPPEATEILLKLGEEIVPLFFRLDVSKIKPISPNKDNLKIEIADKIKISVNSSAMQLPEKFYTDKNLPCKEPFPTLWLICQSYNKLELKKHENQYIYEGVDADIREMISRVNELTSIGKDIAEDPVRFARMLNDKLEKEHKAYLEASEVVNDDDLRLKIEKLIFKKDAKEPPAPKDLREKIRKKKPAEKKQSKTEMKKIKKMNEWAKKYDEMQKAADMLIMKLKKVPLKDLGYSSFQGTFVEEKEKADKKLHTRKKMIENAIRTSSVALIYNDQEYKQFPIKDLLQ